MSWNTVKVAIPIIFTFIIIGFIARLGAENAQINEENAHLQKRVEVLDEKNDGLSNAITSLTSQLEAQMKIAKAEGRRRFAAEARARELNEEVKNALKDDQCAKRGIPDAAVNKLREAAANSVPGGKGSVPANQPPTTSRVPTTEDTAGRDMGR